MQLRELQWLFSELAGEFLVWIRDSGIYKVSVGDFYRSPEQAAINARNGKGILNSNHCNRLAMDLNLWIDERYISDPNAYEPLGHQWESYHTLCRWGGRFPSKDANHFSLEFNGIK